MKLKLILLAAIALIFAGCAKKAPTFSVAQTWTEKPSKLTIVFTEPLVENEDDLKDDIEEYANNFGEWFKLELKKDYETYIKGAIALDYKKVDAEGMIIETDHVDSTEFKTPKPTSMEQGNGYYLAISNVIFTRREDAHANQAYYSSGAAFGANVNPGQNSMAFAGETIVEKGLWIYADYAIYNQSGERVAFGHEEIRSKFAYAMTRSDWEKCVLAFVKRSIARTPILK